MRFACIYHVYKLFFFSFFFFFRFLLLIGGAEAFAVQLRQPSERHRWKFDQLRARPQLAGSGQPRPAALPSAAFR